MIDHDRDHGSAQPPELRELARVLDGVQPPLDLRRRLIDAAAPRSHSTRRAWPLALVGFAAGVAATIIAVRTPRSERPSAHDTIAVVEEPGAPDPACPGRLSAHAVRVPTRCRVALSDIGVVIDVWESAMLSRSDRTIAIAEGAATFDVDPVSADPPIEIDVGAGRVRVLGTRFEIQNSGAIGHLDLIRGRVAFEDRDARVLDIAPGERVSWDRRPPLRAADDPPTESSSIESPATGGSSPNASPPIGSPAKGGSPASGASVRAAMRDHDPPRASLDDTLAEVARLRHAGAYAEAESRLRAAMRESDDARTTEVLSFEIGTLLELADRPSDACSHWRLHVARYADVPSSARARTHLKRLACPSP